jgi:hypothetical protein
LRMANIAPPPRLHERPILKSHFVRIFKQQELYQKILTSNFKYNQIDIIQKGKSCSMLNKRII